MDNPKSKEIWVRELVMALETDGAVMLVSKGRKRYYCPRIQFTGAQEELVDYVKNLINKKAKTYEKVCQSRNAWGKKDLYNVWAEGNANLEPLLKVLKGQMISRRRQRQIVLLLEWIELRRNWRKIKYSPRCDEIIIEISKLNKGETKIDK